MESASDDWFVDFNNDGFPDLAVGRLPVRSRAEADLVVAKLLAYENSSPSPEALLVADINDGFNFELAIDQLSSLAPASLRVTRVKRGQLGDGAAKAAVLDTLNRGPRIAGYSGHASVDLWRANLLTDSDAAQLSNSDHLSVFVMMNCLNGYFIDPPLDSLGASLLMAKGGAAAVYASSAMTLPESQIDMTREFFRQVFANGQIRVGDVILRAKAVTADPDVRRSWILLGDPTMPVR